jgi:hypothetical protein
MVSTRGGFNQVTLSLPPRGEVSQTEILVVNRNGASFQKVDLSDLNVIRNILGYEEVCFGYVWFEGERFILLSSRNTPKYHENRAYMHYGHDPMVRGSWIYGAVVVIGCESYDRMRSLTEFEKDLLWNCIRYVTINRGTDEKPILELITCLCFAEDHPTPKTLITVHDVCNDTVPEDEAVLGPV